jgi:hypothetical protein
MAVEAGTQQERIVGRVWTVRLDHYGRPSAGTVRLSCSRPACPDQRLPGGAAAGRKAAIEHVDLHLAHIRASGGPRDEAWCGGPVALTVYADRAGRLWRIAEMCASARPPSPTAVSWTPPRPRPALPRPGRTRRRKRRSQRRGMV